VGEDEGRVVDNTRHKIPTIYTLLANRNNPARTFGECLLIGYSWFVTDSQTYQVNLLMYHKTI
jgi:hypothetical protein